MGRTARLTVTCAIAWAVLALAPATWAGPVLSTGPYTVNLSNSTFEVSGSASYTGTSWLYSYTVKNLSKDTRRFELGIAESEAHADGHDESNVQILGSHGSLTHDLAPHFTYGDPMDPHNYVFTRLTTTTHPVLGNRLGIWIGAGRTVIMSFEDKHRPTMVDWSIAERLPQQQHVSNVSLGLGRLPAPAPEPGTLTLAALGIGGLGMGFYRKIRRQKAEV